MEQGSRKVFYKYGKVSQQQKFHLLSLVVKQRKSIKEAASIVDVNYSTAKTIIFFHRNNIKSYQFQLSNNKQPLHRHSLVASYSSTTPKHSDYIHIVSSIGSKGNHIDFNTLQTKLTDSLLDHHPPPLFSPTHTYAVSQLGQLQICQCERRTTRAQSVKQAAKFHCLPLAQQQEACSDTYRSMNDS